MNQIEKLMRNLGISKEEAEQLLRDDEEGVSVELTPEQKAVAKEMSQGDRKKETKKRERKPDYAKRFLIDLFKGALFYTCKNIVVENLEREITFTYEGEKYKLILSKPRPEK